MAKSLYTTISKKNPYYISKHRYLELKHFCLQYPEWKQRYAELQDEIARSKYYISPKSCTDDHISELAIEMASLREKMDLVENTAREVDPVLGDYILKAVTRGCTYEFFQTQYDIPCCRDTFYDRYRKYFAFLNRQ